MRLCPVASAMGFNVHGRLRFTTFKPGNVALIGLEPFCQLRLCEAGGGARAHDRGGDRVAARRPSGCRDGAAWRGFCRNTGGAIGAPWGWSFRTAAPGLNAGKRDRSR